LLGSQFIFRDLRLVVACGSLACDSNHIDGSDKLCISYEGSATSTNRWALAGDIVLKDPYKNVPPIEFQSNKLSEVFCRNLGSANSTKIPNHNELRRKVHAVLKHYTNPPHCIMWDLVFWCKYSSIGEFVTGCKCSNMWFIEVINTFCC
jgi:hypothetical protein